MDVGPELHHELEKWELSGKKARFWWRDDDAVSDTPELRRLLSLAEEIGTVVGLAVIPALATDDLVKLAASAPCCVWQHGWRHKWQHEDTDTSYSNGEFGQGRDLETMMAEAQNGQIALDLKFGETGWQKVFVPPFHALSLPFKLLLPSLGYRGLSAGLPLTPEVSTVAEVNAEIDILNWPKRRFHGSDVVERMLVEQLSLRRQEILPEDAPIGLLTHHPAMDEEAWRFLEGLLRFLKVHRAAELLPANLLFENTASNEIGRSSRTIQNGAEPVTSDEVTVAITSCGRQDLLEITLDSFLRHNTFPIKEFIIFEDGDGTRNNTLEDKYRDYPFRWLATGQRVGQVAAIDAAYRNVHTEYIFHCEDDWEFFAPGFLEKSLVLMRGNDSILQVWIRAPNDTNNHPLLDFTLTARGIPYKLLRHHHDAGDWGVWNGFS